MCNSVELSWKQDLGLGLAPSMVDLLRPAWSEGFIIPAGRLSLSLPLQWLVFRRDGTVTAAEYAARAAEASAAGAAVRFPCCHCQCSNFRSGQLHTRAWHTVARCACLWPLQDSQEENSSIEDLPFAMLLYASCHRWARASSWTDGSLLGRWHGVRASCCACCGTCCRRVSHRPTANLNPFQGHMMRPINFWSVTHVFASHVSVSSSWNVVIQDDLLDEKLIPDLTSFIIIKAC